jgi:hypothetical protein
MRSRSMMGCLVLGLAAALIACGGKTPTGGGSTGSASLCQQTQLAGTAVQGASLMHGASVWMLMVQSCGFDMPKLLDAAGTCRDHGACGLPLDQSGLNLINNALGSTLTPLSIGGGPAFRASTDSRTWIIWDDSRDPQQVLSAIAQGTGAPGDTQCCPGCSTCDPANPGPQCPAAGSAPRSDKAPAPGFPPLPGPQVCACDKVCPAHASHQLPDTCDCSNLCHCP